MRIAVICFILGFTLGCIAQYHWDKQHQPDPLDCITDSDCPAFDEYEEPETLPKKKGVVYI